MIDDRLGEGGWERLAADAHAAGGSPGRTPWAAVVRRLVPVLVFVAGVVAYVAVYRVGYTAGQSPVRSDGQGYYAYLPSYLLRHDDSFRSLIQSHFSPPQMVFAPGVFGFSLQPTGHWLDKYPVGEAILLSPFFAIGHVIAVLAGQDANGYSDPEVFAVGLAALVYIVLGLAALGAALRRWFSDWVTAGALAVIALGSGVFHYATYDSTFSHAFSFSCMSVALLLAVRWYECPASTVRAVLLGCAAGLVVAVRLTDVVLMVTIVLLGVGSLTALRQRLALFRRHLPQVGFGIAAGLLMLTPQVLTWYLATHHLLVRPYQGESFDFAHPHLVDSLTSFNPHGLLPYAPVFGIAFAGLLWAWVVRRDLAVPVTLGFLPFWYLVASWWDWAFTAGFGDRAFVDVAPLLAIPIALVFASLPGWRTRVATALLCTLLVGVTCVQMVNYWQGRLSLTGIDPAGYVRILLFHH